MTARPRVLVVDDRRNMLRLAQKILRADAEVLVADSGARAIEILAAERVSLVVSDLRMHDIDGLDVLDACRQHQPQAAFVLMTAYASVATAVEAMRRGAYDYLTKPFEPEELRAVVLRGLGRSESESASPNTPELLPGMFARSDAMREVAELARRLASTGSSAVIVGEPGTGKEQLARAIHELSHRAGRFISVNCAAIPGELLERELFGLEVATGQAGLGGTPGVLEQANDGTLYLGEITAAKASVQARLSRVLRRGKLRRVGEAEDHDLDLRIIAGTHRDVHAMTEDGTFRGELWYALSSAIVELPPLRERPEDVELLARRFLAAECEARPGTPRRFAPPALQLLQACPWPGNETQLRAAVQRACLSASGDQVEVGNLPAELLELFGPAQRDHNLSWHDAMERARDRAAGPYLRMVLAGADGNVAEAARHAGVERESFYRLLRRHGIRPAEFRVKRS